MRVCNYVLNCTCFLFRADYLKMATEKGNDDKACQGGISSMYQNLPECEAHKQISVMYCKDCHEPTCVLCVTGEQHKKHVFSHIDCILENIKEGIVADMDKLEKALKSPYLNLQKDESLDVFDDAFSAIQDHEDMICNAVREISLQQKNEVEKQKEQFVEKSKEMQSLKEKTKKELLEIKENDKSILQSNDATKILNYQPSNEIDKDWPKETKAPSVKFLPGQVGQRELQHMFGKIQTHNTASGKALFNKKFHRNTSAKLPITEHR